MPNIWIPNIDEVGPSFDPKIAAEVSRKYLWFAEDGDLSIMPQTVSPHLIESIQEVRNFLLPITFKIPAGDSSTPLLQRIFQDAKLLQYLRQLQIDFSQRGDPLFLNGYMATPSLLHLSQILNIPLSPKLPTPHFIEQEYTFLFNCKKRIKDWANKLSIPTIPGRVAVSIQDGKEFIGELSQQYKSVILKKSLSGGGYGNLSGTVDKILIHWPEWFTKQITEKDEVIIEPYLSFKEIIGSLALISDDQIDFKGFDLQLIDDDSWQGAFFPHPSLKVDLSDKMRIYTLQLANEIKNLGGRGPLNLDFGLTFDGQLFLLESNFRYNGFYLLYLISSPYLKDNPSITAYYNMGNSLYNDGPMILVDEDPATLKKQYISFKREVYAEL